ncbi:MAG TPA: hypothetical protein VFP68_06270 [Burkholderiaceae bacterium]|nr:hypothetical protein [Burkholderiaceae bacterium]
MGHSLAHYWSLPGIVKDVIRWHDVPANCGGQAAQALAALVQLAEHAMDGHHVLKDDDRVEELLGLSGVHRRYLEEISQEYADLVDEVLLTAASQTLLMHAES